MMVGVDGGNDLGIGCSLNSQRGAAMEGFFQRQHAGAAIMERRELEGILVGLSAGVDKKQAVVVIAAEPAKTASELLLQRIDD